MNIPPPTSENTLGRLIPAHLEGKIRSYPMQALLEHLLYNQIIWLV